MSRSTFCRPFGTGAGLPVARGLSWFLLVLLLFAVGVIVSPTPDGIAAGESRPMGSPSARALYQARCARCHEADGRGRELRDGLPSAPDFTSRHWQRTRSTAQLVTSILDGKGTQMPAFGGKLTRGQARDLVTFVRAFAPSPSTAAADMSETRDEDFETRFRQLEEEFDRLRKQLDELAPRRKP
jgi:mono/diheme cytochrome c family protein